MTTLSLTIRHQLPTYADVMALPGQRHGNYRPAPRVTFAWLLAKTPVVIPIPGASHPESIIDSAQAPGLVLSLGRVSQARR